MVVAASMSLSLQAEISAAQINALLTATNNSVAPYWPALFAGFLKDKMETLLFSLGGPVGGAAAAPAAGAAEEAAPAAEAPAKKKEEVVEEVDLGGGMDMFGGGGEGGSY
jgi:ribosomal protein L12E/L44/L45/RPP1/RPP2